MDNIRIENHIQKLNKLFKYIYQDIEEFQTLYGIPIKSKILEDIENDKNLRRLVDSIISNFSKIQTILGEKLFKEVLLFANDINDKNLSFIEILSVLEKENITNRINWKKLKNIRNNIAHEYPDELEEMANNLNIIFENINFLKNSFVNIKNHYKKAKEFWD